MIIYQPYIDSTDRIAWYGGESTQLHYEQYIKGQWIEQSLTTLMYGIPSGMSEMHAELVDYYNCCHSRNYHEHWCWHADVRRRAEAT